MRPPALAILVVAVVLFGCPRDRPSSSGDGGGPAPRAPVVEPTAPAPHPLPPDEEEQRRRAEAVRRAAEELTSRGVKTQDYLINLIVEDDVYRVSFVRRTGGELRSEKTVRVRRQDFEILSIQD